MNIEIQAKNTASIDNQSQTGPAKIANKNEKEVAKTETETVKTEDVKTKVEAEKIQVTEVSRERIEEAVSKLQDYADQYKRELKFSIDEESGRTVVRLFDGENRELRQIPSEDVLSLAQSLKDSIGGLFEDQV